MLASLGRDSAELDQSGEILRMRFENLLYGVLNFDVAVLASLALNFLRELVGGMQILWVELHCLAQKLNGGSGVSPLALHQA